MGRITEEIIEFIESTPASERKGKVVAIPQAIYELLHLENIGHVYHLYPGRIEKAPTPTVLMIHGTPVMWERRKGDPVYRWVDQDAWGIRLDTLKEIATTIDPSGVEVLW